MLFLLKYRIKYTIDTLKQLGFFYSCILIVFFLAIIINFFSSSNTEPLNYNSKLYYLIVAIYIITLHFIHIKRKDRIFLKSILQYPYINFLLEYSFISIIFWIFLIIEGQYLLFITTIVLIFVLPVYDRHTFFYSKLWDNVSIRVTKYISPNNFEWLSGIRSYWIVYILVYISEFIFYKYKFYSIVVIILISIIIYPNFYKKNEINMYNKYFFRTPFLFILHKIIKHYKLSILFSFPVIFINYFIHLDLLIVFLSFLIQLAIIIWLVCFKYYNYFHSGNTSLSYQYISSTGTLFSALFFPLFFFVIYWKKLKNKLSFYIND